MNATAYTSRDAMRLTVLQHLGKLLVDETDRARLRAPVNASHSGAAIALQGELAHFGQTLGADALGWVDRLADTGDETQLHAIHRTVMETAQIRVGAHVHYRPLFRRFPHDVPDDMEYLIRRVTAAWINHLEPERANRQERVLACGHFINASMFDLDAFGACPICQRQDAGLEIGFDDIAHAVEGRKTRVIGAVLPSELATFARVRLTNASALHPDEREIVTMLYSDPQWQAALPERIGFKENVAIVADALLEAKTPQEVQEALAHEVRSATDVLRIAAAIGGKRSFAQHQAAHPVAAPRATHGARDARTTT